MLVKIFVSLSTVFWAAVFPAAAQDERELLLQFKSEFQNSVEGENIPGAAYAIVKDGRVIAKRTYGVRAKKDPQPVTTRTVFRVASVSKTFAADLAALLMAEGKFTLDTPVTQYVPELRFREAGFEKKLSVRHLLSHSAGFMPNSYDTMVEDGWPMDKILPRFKQLRPICRPGNCYGYQNVLFSLIQPVIEESTGSGYEMLLAERLFKPLDMHWASAGYQAFMNADDRAAPHVLTRSGLRQVRVSPDYYLMAPAAGVNASIEDMAKWLIAQMGYAPQVLPEQVLDAVTVKQIRTKRELYKRPWRPVLSNAHYGLGWRLYDADQGEIIMHGGAVAGFRSVIAFSKELNMGLVMLMNADTRLTEELAAGFWQAVFSSLPQ